jgi:hypothetical protein
LESVNRGYHDSPSKIVSCSLTGDNSEANHNRENHQRGESVLKLGKPIIPIRDASYTRDNKMFDELGLLDTLGYVYFQNSTDLAMELSKRMNNAPPE